ncbi:hypothetical protein Esti_002053 [Eimeria stiedai]
MRAHRSRAAVKKSGLARRRLAEGEGAGGSEDDEIHAIVEDCLSLAEDPARWLPALGPPKLPPVPATASLKPGDMTLAAEEAALLPALEPGMWLEQISVLEPELQSGSLLEDMPAILSEVQPPQSQGAPAVAGEAPRGPSAGGGFFPLTAPSLFLQMPYAAASLHPQTREALQAAAPPIALGEGAGAAEGPSSAAAEGAEGGSPSTSGTPETIKQLLLQIESRGPPTHPFVRLPLVNRASIPCSFNPAAPVYPGYSDFDLPSLLVEVYNFHRQRALDSHQVEGLLSFGPPAFIKPDYEPRRTDERLHRLLTGELLRAGHDKFKSQDEAEDEEEQEKERSSP